MDVEDLPSSGVDVSQGVNFEVLRVLLDEGAIVRVEFVDGVNKHLFFPLLSRLPRELIVVEQIGRHQGLRLHPAVLAGDCVVADLVVVIIAGDPSENAFLDDGDFVLVGAGDAAGVAVSLGHLDAHGRVHEVGVICQGPHVHFPEVQRRGPVATLSAYRSVAETFNAKFPTILYYALSVYEGEQEVEAVEMFFGEDVQLCVLILGHDDLLGSEEGTKLLVKIHFLLVAGRVVTDPKVLRVCFKADVEHAEGEYEEEGDCPHDNDPPVLEVEPAQSLKNHLKVHQFIYITTNTHIILLNGHQQHHLTSIDSAGTATQPNLQPESYKVR